jgi:hypothetical protein
MIGIMKRLQRRMKVHGAFLQIGLRDRIERRKSLWLERVSQDGGFVQFSLVWPAPSFPGHLLTGIGDAPCQPQDLGRARLGRAAGRRFRHYFWLPVGNDGLTLPQFAGKPMTLRAPAGVVSGETGRQSLTELRNLLRWPAPRRVPAGIARQRAAAVSAQARQRFRGAWVLIDHAERADDNAEHFYRYLQGTPEAERIHFVLSRQSKDWDRLEREGFRILEFGSADHIAAVTQASIVASSQASVPVFWPMPEPFMRDLVNYQFVFLQHGMIMNDLSSWLNHLPIDLMVTTTPHEFAAVTASDSPYRFSPRDCVLSGLPRHDALLARPRQKRWLTVAPTWRKWLVSQSDARSMARGRKAGFSQSEFARAWGHLLADPQLAQTARQSGLDILFVPHPNLRPVVGDLALAKHVTLYDPKRHGSYQEVIAATALCLTDYSSLTVDMAVLDIPQVYYQFDAEMVFNGSHSIGPGYFDYGQDGFGQVARRPEEVLAAIARLQKGQEDPIFAQRRKETLVYRDGTCCRRLHDAILHRLEIDRERFCHDT